jgi:hypothetical protein
MKPLSFMMVRDSEMCKLIDEFTGKMVGLPGQPDSLAYRLQQGCHSRTWAYGHDPHMFLYFSDRMVPVFEKELKDPHTGLLFYNESLRRIKNLGYPESELQLSIFIELMQAMKKLPKTNILIIGDWFSEEEAIGKACN